MAIFSYNNHWIHNEEFPKNPTMRNFAKLKRLMWRLESHPCIKEGILVSSWSHWNQIKILPLYSWWLESPFEQRCIKVVSQSLEKFIMCRQVQCRSYWTILNNFFIKKSIDSKLRTSKKLRHTFDIVGKCWMRRFYGGDFIILDLRCRS